MSNPQQPQQQPTYEQPVAPYWYQQQAASYGYQQPPQQAKSGAQYVRQQKGHSIIGLVLLDWMTLYTRTIYFAISPNHFFHA